MGGTKSSFFKKALAVWVSGKENDINSCIELECKKDNVSEGTLKITGATFYQVFADDKILHYGPAKKADGYSAVDIVQLPIAQKITIRAMGYNCRSLAAVSRSSFIQAEIEKDGEVVAATGYCGFDGYEALYRKQKVMRYSYQRHFSESWDYTQDRVSAELSIVNGCDALIPRGVPYGKYDYINKSEYKRGKWKSISERRIPLFVYLTEPNLNSTYFPLNELETYAYDDYLKTKCKYSDGLHSDGRLSYGECGLYDFGKIEAGFFGLKLKAKSKSRILLGFSEQLDDDKRPAMIPLNSVNVIEWILPEGEYDLITCEAYTVKYAELLVMDGEIELDGIGIYEVAFPKSEIKLDIPKNSELAKIYEAAAETFRHNTFDILMDCPSRERAGWLYDSFYTARAEYYFSGKADVEKEFLNSYLHSPDVINQKGMINECYPADVFSGGFIPQWSMWYVLEVYEHLTKRRGSLDKDLLNNQLDGLLKWFGKYENEYGLLEKMPGWNFVEWSEVNNRVQDVSFPTNMLYSKMLEVIGKMCDNCDLEKKAEKLKGTIVEMAFDGKLFCDRAVRNEDGVLTNTDERSEVSQYYALLFDIADINDEKFLYLRHMVLDVFGPNRTEFPNIEFANSMPGLYMRMELLLRWKKYEQLLSEIKGYFLDMAKETGTLWEGYEGKSSRDHGFASYVAVAINKAYK